MFNFMVTVLRVREEVPACLVARRVHACPSTGMGGVFCQVKFLGIITRNSRVLSREIPGFYHPHREVLIYKRLT
jgi:hypothetical protein